MSTSSKAAHSLRITGPATIYTAQALHSEFQAAIASGAVIHLDLSELAEIDTAGLQLFLLLQRECALQTRELKLVAAAPVLEDLITRIRGCPLEAWLASGQHS